MNNPELVDYLKSSDNPRASLIGLLNASKLPSPLKMTGYMFLSAASDQQINNIKAIFIQAVGFIRSNDMTGLKNYLTNCGFENKIIEMVLNNVANSDKNQ